MQIAERFIKKIREGGVNYNPDTQVAPFCILWPDKDRQWEGMIETLLTDLPELLVLGEYDLEKRSGPAIWVRCVIAGKIQDLKFPHESKPIIYLPGVGRQDLRDIKEIPDHLRPLAELQYRGTIWSQTNSRDWTVLSFLKSDQGGMGLDVSQDNESKHAMLRALQPIFYGNLEELRGKRLDKDFFNNLLAGDYARRLLLLLDKGDAFRLSMRENEWQAFAEICRSKLSFSPDEDGILTAAAKLASHDVQWEPVWERFSEAPHKYPNIPNLIKSCKPPTSVTWWTPGKSDYDRWPQWNEEQENILRRKMEAIDNMSQSEARRQIADLEKEHRLRRNLVWAELGEASLARALEHLSSLAHISVKSLAAGTINDLVAGYGNESWQVDDAVLRSLSYIEKDADFEAIRKVISAIYKPWAEDSARHLQQIVNDSGYPGGNSQTSRTPMYKAGQCILFVDGLRFDVARRLGKLLKDTGCQIKERQIWAPLPTVTATGKPAVTPVHDKISGEDGSDDFEPVITKTHQSLKGGYQLKKLMADSGWQILDASMKGDVKGNAWCEFGDIDREGHARGWKVAKYIDNILDDIQDRVKRLFNLGWQEIHIVTDHGWILLPGNLQKAELPGALTETEWGRCAEIKPGALTKERMYPWYWNPNYHFALADGISCFRNGVEYAHGGISLQECLTIEIVVLPGQFRVSQIIPRISEVVWKGLRCNVAVDSAFEGLSIDIRSRPNDPSSSVVVAPKELKDNRTASIIVENEDLEGTSATIVLINQQGELVAQTETIIGES